MKRKFIMNQPGKQYVWGFVIWGTEADAAEWRADGLEVFELANTIPAWVVSLGLTRVWIALQDLWNWPSTWGKK